MISRVCAIAPIAAIAVDIAVSRFSRKTVTETVPNAVLAAGDFATKALNPMPPPRIS